MSTQKTVLKTGASLGLFLDGVINESVKSALHQKALQEKEKQAQASEQGQDGGNNSGGGDDGDTDLFGGGDSGGDEGADQQDTSSKTMDADTETLEQGDVEPKDIVDKLNAIRSGKSFKDEQVSAAMDEYVGSLSKAEKTALFAFLKGIAQIVTGEVPGQQAVDPEDKPAQVSMEKGPEKAKSKHIEPNVIVGSRPKEKVKGGSEDTTGPTPIVPKRR